MLKGEGFPSSIWQPTMHYLPFIYHHSTLHNGRLVVARGNCWRGVGGGVDRDKRTVKERDNGNRRVAGKVARGIY